MNRTEELINKWLDEGLSTGETAELDAALDAQRTATRTLASLFEMELLMRALKENVDVTENVMRAVRLEAGRKAAEGRPIPGADVTVQRVPGARGRVLGGPWERSRRIRWPIAAAIAVAGLLGVMAGSYVLVRLASERAANLRPSEQKSASARVTEVKGQCLVAPISAGGFEQVSAGAELADGSVLRTGGNGSGGQLDFGGGKVGLTLAERTEATVKVGGGEPQGSWGVELRAGQVEAHIHEKGVRFEVSTAVGSARAVGTRFVVKLITDEAEKEINGVRNLAGVVMVTTVISGVVDVTGPSGTQTAVAGDRIVVSERGATGGGVKAVVGEMGEAPRATPPQRPEVTLTGKLTKEVTPAPESQLREHPEVKAFTIFTLTTDDGRKFTVMTRKPVKREDGTPSGQNVDLTPFVDQDVKIVGTVHEEPASAHVTSITSIEKLVKPGK